MKHHQHPILFWVVLFLQVDSSAFECVMAMMVGVMSLLAWHNAMNKGNLLDLELIVKDATFIHQKNLANANFSIDNIYALQAPQ